MDQFQLVTDLTPKGDQPEAIEALTSGILVGKKAQMLLGVTGSGKSLAADAPLWIYEENASRQIKPHVMPIGPFIDHIIDEATAVALTMDGTQIVDLQTMRKRYFALSINPRTRAVEIKPVTSVLRHRAPTTLYRVTTECGRQVDVTSDHNFWVLRDGRLVLMETNQIRKTDYLPLPLLLPPANRDLEWLDATQLLAGEPLLVEANGLVSKAVARKGWVAITNILGRYYRYPDQKLRKLQRCGDGQGVPLGVLQEIARVCQLTLTPRNIRRVAIGSQFHDYTIPGALPISDELLRLLGYYIAEGHGEPSHRFFTITTASPIIVNDLVRTLRHLRLGWRRDELDVDIASKVHSVLLARLSGVNARSKRLPAFWPTLSQRQLAELLKAYFEGDGAVTPRNGVVAVTASRQLASDISYALLRFGIRARVYRTWQRATNSKHRGAFYWYLAISGRENLQMFLQGIGFLSKRKQNALIREAAQAGDAKGDLIPGAGSIIRRFRCAIGLSQTALAARCGVSRPTITVVEAGVATPRRSTVQKLLQNIGTLLPENGTDLDEELESWVRCRWSRVNSVKRIPYKGPYVYDLSVANNETFLAGLGGLFVHNTFTIANVIERVQKPTLIVSHNKTLAAQLYSEFKSLFPHNAVEYFVSYYDYYQPEAYVPQTDTYIEKDASINDDLDRLRLSATSSLLSRRDTIIVASVSCIYNLGDPSEYRNQMVWITKDKPVRRDELLSWLVGIHYTRNDVAFGRGTFRARGDVVNIFPAYRQTANRVILEGNRIVRIQEIHPVTSEPTSELEQLAVYPAKHFLTDKGQIASALELIRLEMVETVRNFQAEGKLLEAQRLESRTKYDLDMLKELGYCHGVENYSRPLSGRPPGSRPFCLIDYFPKDFLMVIDESHVTIPQIRGMSEGDRARKEVLVEYGFRLPSALDNRPQKFDEFESLMNQVVFVSATPSPYELQQTEGKVVEQVIRPTGLVDPTITIKPTSGQIDDLIEQVRQHALRKERVLVTTLTKRMSEDLSRYLAEAALRVKYLHSEIEAIERVEILHDLRRGEFDCLVGINLLREGLDLPEVSLVAVLDADKEGFLRSATSLIQVAGRAARNVNGQVILYADHVTGAMRQMITETNRRRTKQLAYNQEHQITPTTIVKAIKESIETTRQAEEFAIEQSGQTPEQHEVRQVLSELEDEMLVCAKSLQFERAAVLRDEIHSLKEKYHLSEEATRPVRRRPRSQ